MSIPVDLWLWSLDRPAEEVAALSAPLSEAERQRAARFVKPEDGAHFAVARGRLRQILAGYSGTAPDDLTFVTTGRGKPVLTDGPAFNLSHSGSWAALAVAPETPDLQLGVDIEAIRKINPGVATRSFSAAEQDDMRRLLPASWMRGFFNAWTRKEAVIKATGHGLTLDLKSFDVSLIPDEPARFRASRGPLPGPDDWAMINLDTGAGYCGALAAVTHGAPLGPVTLREGQLPLGR